MKELNFTKEITKTTDTKVLSAKDEIEKMIRDVEEIIKELRGIDGRLKKA